MLTDADWEILRTVRLAAFRDSPESFVAGYDEEAQQDEQFWRDRLRRSRWFVAEREGEAIAVVALGTEGQEPGDGEIFGLWVSPEDRRSRLGWDLVRTAVNQAAVDGHSRLYFWVVSDNGPAVALASVLGFRPTAERRTVRTAGAETDTVEIAMVLTLTPDPMSVVNPEVP